MKYVIGIDGGSTKCLVKIKDLSGHLLAESQGKTVNHLVVGAEEARRRIGRQIRDLLSSFNGSIAECACTVVGAAGIDSPHEKVVVERLYNELLLGCPVFCMNDGSVALYAATKGIGIISISGTGSIVVGRNKEGKVTRSGGYPCTIFGNEGSSQWIALNALRYASQWVDGTVGDSPLIEKMHEYFQHLDANKLVECAVALRRRPVDSQLAVLVYEAAKDGDAAARHLIEQGAVLLVDVAETCVKKLKLDQEEHFLSGAWGSVFVKNEFFFNKFRDEFTRRYPASQVILPDGDAADGATQLALDYLDNRVDFIQDL